MLACAVVGVAGTAHAQELDLAVGGSTLFASAINSASQTFQPPPEKGGTYPTVSAEYLFRDNNRVGFNVETAFRYKHGFYDGYQQFRPVFYDANAVFAPRFSHKIVGDFMAGVGGESLIFYNQFRTCYSGACVTNVNATHFLLHAEGGARYYFWRQHLFARPEAHYYRILNNSQFHSGNVLRLGATIGYTFGSE